MAQAQCSVQIVVALGVGRLVIFRQSPQILSGQRLDLLLTQRSEVPLGDLAVEISSGAKQRDGFFGVHNALLPTTGGAGRGRLTDL